jgi:hypothetical protein
VVPPVVLGRVIEAQRRERAGRLGVLSARVGVEVRHLVLAAPGRRGHTEEDVIRAGDAAAAYLLHPGDFCLRRLTTAIVFGSDRREIMHALLNPWNRCCDRACATVLSDL